MTTTHKVFKKVKRRIVHMTSSEGKLFVTDQDGVIWGKNMNDCRADWYRVKALPDKLEDE